MSTHGFRQVLAYERRLQDIEMAIRNQHRNGKVTDVKYDKERKGWFARMRQGDEGPEAFLTDWLPWKSFSHGTIQSSIPPRKGMMVAMSTPQGSAEQGFLEPYHYDPDNTSPHDKEDEVFFRIKAPDQKYQDKDGKDRQPTDDEKQQAEDQDLKMKFTKDGVLFTLGKTSLSMGAKGFKLTHDKNSWEMTPDMIKSSMNDGKSVVELTKDKVSSKSDTVKAESTDGSGSITVNDSGVDTQGKKINDG